MKVYYEGVRIGEDVRAAHIVHETKEEGNLCREIIKSITSEASYYKYDFFAPEATFVWVDDKSDYDDFMKLWKKHKKIVKASKK